MIETRFKDTEIGRIPEDWEVKALGDVFSVGNGRDYKHLSFGDIPVYGTGGYMTSVSDYLHDGETVCIGRKGTIDEPQYHTGKIWTVDTLFFTYGFQNVCVKYLFYLFNRIEWKKYNEATGVPSLTSKNILAITAQFPKLSEQSRIAKALSNVDALISELGKLIEKKRAIKQGAMQQLLTGKKRIQGFSELWVEKKLGEVCEFQNGYTPSKAINSFWESGTIPWFRMEDIRTNGRILSDAIQHITEEAVKGNLFPANSIIMSTTATIGEHALLIVDSLANQRFTNLTIRKSLTQAVDVIWFYHYCFILGEWCRRNINEGGLAAVNMEDFSKVTIAVPHIKEQKAIASVLTSMDDEIAALEAKKAKYEQIKQGMMQQLLTGKIRLTD